jgi:hypothetical protein
MTCDKNDQLKSTTENHIYGMSILEDILSEESLKQEVAAVTATRISPTERYLPLIGLCIDIHHPTLLGRALVRVEIDGAEKEHWMPTLHGMSIRPMDRVLVQTPKNGIEPIVIGVVDGFKMRPELEHIPGPVISLLSDESVKVNDVDGNQLLEVYRDESGPVVRLLSENTNIDLPGKLRISAKSIELAAKDGEAKISASKHVVVEGEMIRLN